MNVGHTARRRATAGVVAVAAGIVPVLAWAGTAAPVAPHRQFSATNQLAARPSGPPSTTFPISYDGNYYGWVSSNWSGYAVTGSYSSVHAEWSVPAVAPSRPATYSAVWTGLDGFSLQDPSLIQTGTEQDFYGGAAHYNAWWSTSTSGFAEHVITSSSPDCMSGQCGTVAADDAMTATIEKSSPGEWTITLSDVTEGWNFKITTAYDGNGQSAEWVVEAPALSPNGIGLHQGKLADYGTVTFDNGKVDGGSPGFVANATASDAGLLVPHDGHVASVPSPPDSDQNGFTVAYGSTAPSAPGS